MGREPVTVLGWFGLKSLVSSCVTVLCLNAWDVVVVVVDFPQQSQQRLGELGWRCELLKHYVICIP